MRLDGRSSPGTFRERALDRQGLLPRLPTPLEARGRQAPLRLRAFAPAFPRWEGPSGRAAGYRASHKDFRDPSADKCLLQPPALFARVRGGG